MGIEPGKLVGQNSGATAADLAKKPDLGELPVGKLTQVQLKSGKSGDPWVDQGAHCDNSYADGCFLGEAQRTRLVIKILDRLNRCATNYKLALEQMRVDELLKKEEDIPWIISLALDVATGFIAGKVTKALTKLRTEGATRVLNAEFVAGEAVDHTTTDKILAGLSDKQIETWTKKAFDAAGKQVKAIGKKAQGAAGKSDKAESISFIDQLTNACDIGFEQFGSSATATSNDGELLTLFDGLDPANHSVGLYKAALEDKLGRFRKSGVTNIGRKIGKDRETGYVDVKQDTRVVWMRDDSFGTRLWYQEQDADHDPTVVQPGDPGSDVLPTQQPDKLDFGTRSPRNDAKLIKIVPDEFKEAAIARSEAIWGPTPTLDSPMRQNYLQQIGSSTMTTPSTSATPPPLVAGAVTGSGAGTLPAGSVFGRKKTSDTTPPPAGPVAPPTLMTGQDPKGPTP